MNSITEQSPQIAGIPSLVFICFSSIMLSLSTDTITNFSNTEYLYASLMPDRRGIFTLWKQKLD
jgi:hypothetical protein